MIIQVLRERLIPHNIPNPNEAALIQRKKGANTPTRGSLLTASTTKDSDNMQKDMAMTIKGYTPFDEMTANGMTAMRRNRERICSFKVCGV